MTLHPHAERVGKLDGARDEGRDQMRGMGCVPGYYNWDFGGVEAGVGERVMAHLSSELCRLFADLQLLRFVSGDRESHHENLVDILEIVAVAAELKPAHLSGQGLSSPELLHRLELLAPAHGLFHQRTLNVRPFHPRAPRYDARIWESQLADERRQQEESPHVLWIFRQPEIRAALPDVVSGVTSVAAVLGYPQCCVDYRAELGVRVVESYVEALRQAFNVTQPDDILRLVRDDTAVETDPHGAWGEILESLTRSRVTFPYTSFEACPPCLTEPNSPAAVINITMRDLAAVVSESFVREIEAAARQSAPAQAHPRRRPTMRPNRKVGRNDPCPCGSGRKFKKCCGQAA